MRHSISTALAVMLVVSGCSNGSRQRTVTGTSTTGSTADASTTSSSAVGRSSVVLSGGGLSAARDWRFGSDAKLVTADLARAFGTTPTAETMDCEAGGTELRMWPELTALMQDGTFVGWSTPPTSRDLRTDRGIGLGSRRSDLVGAYPDAEVVQSSLGTEWSVDDGGRGFLAGLLDGEANSAAVSAMWSGNACVFR